MSMEVRQNFPNGYIVEFAPVDDSGNFTSAYCESWLLLPAENLWPNWLRGVLYVIGLLFCFIGVAIGSDVFMTSIEVITSKKRTIVVYDEEGAEHVQREVLIWNETVANLTLLALGSSAPEILLAVIETINDLIGTPSTEGSNLGFYTIIGSAAFNLLLITGICIVSIPSPDYKRVEQFGVFILTAVSSLLAYVWLLVVMLWNSPGVVEPWEAWVTFIYFPLLVLTAYATDNGWWKHRWWKSRAVQDGKEVEPAANGIRSRRGSYTGRAIPLSPEKRRKFNENSVAGVNNDSFHHFNSPRQKTRTANSSVIACKALPMDSLPKMNTTTQNSPTPVMKRQQEVRQPFARARFRHAAIRSLGGIRRIPISLTQADTATGLDSNSPSTQPRFLSVVSRLATMQKIDARSKAIQDESSGALVFAASSYAVLESAGELVIDVLLNRRKRTTGTAVIPTTTSDGKFDIQSVAGVIAVDYETREGTAKINKDFKYSSGTLVFTEKDFCQKISIPIINDNQYNPDTDFYVILKNPSGDAILGDPSVSRITIIDDDKPGDFVLEQSQLYADSEAGEVVATVLRQNGCDGNVHVNFSTIDGTAKGGKADDVEADYIATSGILKFKHQETSKVITVPINKEKKDVKNFVIVLRNPSTGSHLGDHSAAVANLNLPPGGLNNLSRVLMEENETSWSGQFSSAMRVGGEVDELGNETPPSRLSYFLHFLSMPWKLFFAFTPTRNTWGGYPAFLVSMLLVGAVTAVIEQFGNLLGCVTGLSQQVTGITIIAIGTSLPDTIASRTAALQDSTADAAIGNITGSNSVNVFLGLGLPWVIRTCYHLVNGGTYRVNTDALDFSVILFDSLGTVCVVGLILRRFFLGGELGGKSLVKWLSGGFLLLLWLVFIVVASLRAHNHIN